MAKKSGKIKIPKRVAGIKIPRVVRKGPLGQFLNSHAGQVILAEAVVAAAAMFTAAKADEDSTAADTLRHPLEGSRRLGHAVMATGTDQAERLAHAFREAGRTFRETLRGGDDLVWQDRPDIGAEEPRVKKKSSARGSHATRH